MPLDPAKTSNGQQWRYRALCHPRHGHDPELWFPPQPRPYVTHAEHEETRRARIAQENTAKAICVQCPVRRECLEYADQNDIREGIYGGMTPVERGKVPLR
jgi:hypothetical protein